MEQRKVKRRLDPFIMPKKMQGDHRAVEFEAGAVARPQKVRLNPLPGPKLPQ